MGNLFFSLHQPQEEWKKVGNTLAERERKRQRKGGNEEQWQKTSLTTIFQLLATGRLEMDLTRLFQLHQTHRIPTRKS